MVSANTSRKRHAPNTLGGRQTKRVQQAPDARGRKKAGQQGGTSIVAPTDQLSVYVFGEGSAGELGLGSQHATNVSVPRRNPKLTGVVSVVAGGMHCAALTADNRVLTWGVNDQAALGRDATCDGGLRDVDVEKDSDTDSEADLNPLEWTPTAIPTDALPANVQVFQIAAGDSTTFVLGQDGSVYGWGTFRDGSGIYGFTPDPTTGDIVKVQ